jgi:type I restriction enzyme, S subunit
MALKPGFKWTEAGLIPKDWDFKALQEIAVIHHGFGFKSQYFKSHGMYRLATPGHFYENGGFRDIGENQKFYDGPLPKGYLFAPGDLMVAMTEQAEGLLGSAALIPSGDYLHNQRLGKVEVLSGDISPAFLYRIFNSQGYRTKVRKTAAGTKVRHTSPAKLLEIAVPIPGTIAEQEIIAEALSDADALTESLEQLLVKKRDIKQGTMQKLLNGKKRLPGFSGKWVVKSIGDVLRVAHGRSQHEVAERDGAYPILATGGQIGTTNQFLYDRPSVLIGRKGTIDQPRYMDQPFWTVDTLFYTEVYEPNNPKFLLPFLFDPVDAVQRGIGCSEPQC